MVANSPCVTPEKAQARSSSLHRLWRPSRDRLVVLVLGAWCGLLFFYGLTAGEMYRTEGLRAILADEFLRSGNWVVPTLYGEPLFTKPPGMYAAVALVSWPFGQVHEWTARLPSALAATVIVLLMFCYFRRQLGATAGLLAAAMTPLSFMWLDKATAAEIDMLQVAWVTAAIVCFLRALENEEETGRCWRWWLAALLCVAGGVLTKWTAPAFFYGTVVPLLCWRGRLRLLFRREHLVSAAVGAGICFAWAGLAVSLGGWDAFYDTVSREALMRLAPAQYSQAYPWRETLLHPLRLLAASLPCSAFALLTLRPGFARAFDDRGRRLLQALHCWTWPNVLFWSFVSQHSPRHSFPLFPGLAGLAALCWLAWLKGWQRWPLPGVRPGRVLVGLLVLWLAVKLVFVHVSIPRRMHGREPRAKGEQLAALVPAGQTLYLFRVKDEGIMFYYRRPVRRLKEPAQLPSPSTPVYCILDAVEWQAWPRKASSEVLLKSRDEQGDPLVLVRLWSESGSSR